MSMTETDPAHLREIWARVFNHVRTEVDVATVWLAMQAAVPVTLDGPFFVVGLSDADLYLASNLEGAEATAAIETALQQITGRVLAFRVIEGTTALHWQAQKPTEVGMDVPLPAPPPAAAPSPTPPPSERERGQNAPSAQSVGGRSVPPPLPSQGEGRGGGSVHAHLPVAQTWEKLTENLAAGYKTAPFTKYAPGQARYILRAAQMISDTMDVLLANGGATPDEPGERQLMKVLERFGAVINLDPLFIMLEVLRLRARQGRG